jgi:anti-sigma regulatory factor (Ser/Thr protein kinase)
MAGEPHWSHTSTFQATALSASRVRAFVVQQLLDHQLLHLADRIRLVASELATNALVHAGTDFSVTLSADDRAVLLTVRDDNVLLPAQRVAQLIDATNGRGLEIVSIVSTDWGVNDEGGSKAVWASFAVD